VSAKQRIDDPRNRRTDGFNRARARLELRRGVRPSITVIIVTAAAVAAFAWMATQIAPTLLSPSYTAKFAVRNASSVVPNVNEVRIKGVPVGSVKKIEHIDDQAVVTVRIEKEFGRIYKDAQIRLRPNTALNDMYFDIVDRGTEQAGVLGQSDVLPRSRTATPVNIDEVLNTFQPDARRRLRTLLDDLGHGMEDRGESLRAVFVQLVPFLQGAGQLADQLADRDDIVRRLIHNTNVLTEELGSREVQLRTLLTEGGQTLTTLQDGSADLDATLRELPPTLSTVQRTFTAVRGTLGDVDTAVRALYPVADRLPTSLTDLRELAETADPAVDALRKPVSDLVPFASELRPLAGNLDRAISALAPETDTIDKVTRDLELCEQPIVNFFQWNASISKFGDKRGSIPRGNLVLGARYSSFLHDPNEIAPQACSPGRPIAGRVPRPEDLN
jgi:virulence factor Mce-like protein